MYQELLGLPQRSVTYSYTLKVTRQIFGPKGRVTRRNNRIQIGVQEDGLFVVFGEGDTYQEAMSNTIREAALSRMRVKQEEAAEAARQQAAEAALPEASEISKTAIAIDSSSDPSKSSEPNSVSESV